jgi:hypothetical protein
MHAVLSPIDWRGHLFSGGDREIAGKALWIAPGGARINENVWLTKLPLGFTIRAAAHTLDSKPEAKGPIGWLRYDPPFEAAELMVKHDAQLTVVLVVTPEQFADLWERGPDRVPQRIFIEVEGFRDQYQYTRGDQIWEINPAEHAEVRIKACTFQNVAGLTTDRAVHQETRFGYLGDHAVADVRALIEQHAREYDDGNKPQHNAILKDLYACVGREFTRRGEVYRSELDEQITDVEQLVSTLDLALNPKQAEESVGGNDNPSKKLWIWRRGKPATVFQEGLKSPSRRTVDKWGLGEAARKYLQMQYLRSDLLEWIIVDAFVLCEVQEFGETVKQGAGFGSLLWLAHEGRLRLGAVLFWQLILTLTILAGWIAGLAYVFPLAGESTLAALLVFGACVVFFMLLTGRRIFVGRPHNKMMLLQEMMKTYALLDVQAGVASPQAIRSALLDLQNKGAVWDAAALAILDTAAARSRPAWLL